MAKAELKTNFLNLHLPTLKKLIQKSVKLDY